MILVASKLIPVLGLLALAVCKTGARVLAKAALYAAAMAVIVTLTSALTAAIINDAAVPGVIGVLIFCTVSAVAEDCLRIASMQGLVVRAGVSIKAAALALGTMIAVIESLAMGVRLNGESVSMDWVLATTLMATVLVRWAFHLKMSEAEFELGRRGWIYVIPPIVLHASGNSISRIGSFYIPSGVQQTWLGLAVLVVTLGLVLAFRWGVLRQSRVPK